jgi:hypothetical protein
MSVRSKAGKDVPGPLPVSFVSVMCFVSRVAQSLGSPNNLWLGAGGSVLIKIKIIRSEAEQRLGEANRGDVARRMRTTMMSV